MILSDQQLITAHLSGDDSALPELVHRYIKQVYNLARRLTGNAEDAEDITQESFVKVWRNLGKYRQEENFKTWLFVIARNTAIDHLRKKRRLVFSDFTGEDGADHFAETLSDPEPLADELFARVEEKEVLDRAVLSLAPIYREVLALHYGEELTFDEIGKVLGKPLDTVKSQHRRALSALRKLLNAPNKPFST